MSQITVLCTFVVGYFNKNSAFKSYVYALYKSSFRVANRFPRATWGKWSFPSGFKMHRPCVPALILTKLEHTNPRTQKLWSNLRLRIARRARLRCEKQQDQQDINKCLNRTKANIHLVHYTLVAYCFVFQPRDQKPLSVVKSIASCLFSFGCPRRISNLAVRHPALPMVRVTHPAPAKNSM